MGMAEISKVLDLQIKHNSKGELLMTLDELNIAALDYSAIAYDPNYAVAINEGEFEGYRSNYGCNYYLYLHNVVKLIQPKNVLELGTNIGRSAMFMMTALPADGKLTTIDMGSFIRNELIPFENDTRLNIVYGSDTDEAVYTPLNLSNIDMLFIDTEHTYEHVSQEWLIYKNLLTPDAIVVMDDIHLSDGMTKFWNELTYEKIDVGEKAHISGFGIFKYAKDIK